MAWARHVGATLATNIAGTGQVSVSFGNLGATPAVGDRIIAVFDTSVLTSSSAVPCHVTGVTDVSGMKWARDFILQASHNSIQEELSVWSAYSTTGAAATSITIAITPALASGASGCSCAIGAYSGLASGLGLAVDQNGYQDLVSGGAAGATPSTTYDSGITLVGSNKASLLVIGAHADAGASTTLSAGTGYTVFVKTDANSNGQCVLEDKDSGSAGGPLQSTVTASGSSFGMSAVLVYRLSAGNTQLRSIRPGPYRPGLAR